MKEERLLLKRKANRDRQARQSRGKDEGRAFAIETCTFSTHERCALVVEKMKEERLLLKRQYPRRVRIPCCSGKDEGRAFAIETDKGGWLKEAVEMWKR